MREAEQIAAAHILGVESVTFLHWPDSEVEPTLELRRTLVHQIRRHRPDLVITHDPVPPYRLHPDHRAVGRATLDAIFPCARDPLTFAEQIREEGLQAHIVPEAWLFATETPDIWVNISSTLPRKIAARLAHTSQHTDPQELARNWHRRASVVGDAIGIVAGEAYYNFLFLCYRIHILDFTFVASLAATITAIDNPARQAFLSDLVGKEALLNAVALNASVYNGAAVIGPTLAGLFLLRIGAAGCFAFNAFSFLAVVCALLIIARANKTAQKDITHVHSHNTHIHTTRTSRDSISFTSSVRAFGQLRHERTILAVSGIAAVASLLGRPYLLLMPAFARTVQHVGPAQLGLMVAASGLGSFIGSVSLATLNTSQHLQRLLLICGTSFGIVLALFALTPLFPISIFILVACGAGATMTMTVANTLLQTQSPTDMRGRVMSLYTLIAAGLTPLGALLVSSLGAGIGLGMATAIMGAGIVVCVITGYKYLNVRT